MTRRLIPLRQAAELLSLDEKTIRRYVADGRLTGYRIGARVLRVDAEQVAALAQPINYRAS